VNESGIKDTAVIVSRAVPSSLVLRAGKANIERFIAAVTTTVAMPASYDPVQRAITEYTAAASVANASKLLATHVSAWSDVWGVGGIEVLGVSEDDTGE
jgi:hypothetical protein